MKNKENITKEIGKRRYIILSVIWVLSIILLMQLISAATPESYRPYLHKPSTGQSLKLEMYGNFQTQLFPGAATYSYSIAVPTGVVGLVPTISVSYSSQSVFQNPSMMGAGWAITSNYIMRHVNFTVSNITDDFFILNLNGYSDKVFLKNGTFKTNIDKYFKIDNKTVSGNQYWTVTMKDGVKYTFGFTTDSSLKSNATNATLKWFLNNIEDTHGNDINYSYLKNPFSGDKGAVYLSNITYNNDRLRKIVFRYEGTTRTDLRLVYEQGDEFLETRRVAGVDIYFNNSLVRKYSFTYRDLTSSNNEKTMSSLANITYIGADNSSVLHSIKFDYYDPQPGFNLSGKWLVPEEFTSLDTGSKDLSLRLIDVNNDGFADLVKSNATANYTKLNDKNSTWNSTTLFSVPEQIVDSNNDYQGVLFVDVDKDGLVDIIKSKNGAARKVYLNNGTAWQIANTWSIPVDFFNSSSGDEGVRLVELDGDGRVDLIQAKTTGAVKKAWLNNGTGWTNVSLWNVPDYFITTDGKDTGLREIDLNGDGLTDLMKGGEPGSAWLNNGTDWVNNTGYRPNLNFTDNINPDLGVRFMDINGDNLPDVLQNFFSNVSFLNQTCFDQTNSSQNCTLYNITATTNTKINNGSGWVAGVGWISPERFTDSGFNTGRRIADVNGDGYSDIIVGYKNGTFERKTYIWNVTNSFMLRKITNEYGGITSIYYDKSTLWSNGQNLGFNLWLVRNISVNNSIGGSFGVFAKTFYNYSGGKYDYRNSEFLGFNIVNETLPDSTIISHNFHQDVILKGNEYLTQIFGTGNKRYKEIQRKFTNDSDNRIYLNVTSEQIYEGNPTAVIINISYKYDSFGNVLFVNYSGNIAVNGDEKLEQYDYVYNTTAYIVDKVSNYSLFNTSSTLAKRTWFYYDNLANGVTKGDLTGVIQYNNNGQNPEVNYTYDNFGNKVKEIDALGNVINYSYDSATNSYLIKKLNALNHSLKYGYDLGTGNVLFEEKEGIFKNYSYDTFGRMTKEILPQDSATNPTKRTTYEFDGISPEKTIVETKNNDTSYSETIYFYDGFSNLFQSRIKYDSSKQIVSSYLYDGKFRIIEEKTPYFEVYSNQSNSSSNMFNIIYRYDALDRVINLTKRDNSTILITFSSTKVVSTNENKIQKEYILDAYERIIGVYEHNRNSSGDEIYNTSYYYDVSNNLIKVVDSQANQFLFEYDNLGRKISLDDPNMDKWKYAYDLNGNLINQTDGRNVSVYILYDQLNRPTNKSSGNISVIFGYDRQINGTLSFVNYTNSLFEPIWFEYKYDNRSRVTGEKMYFDYIPGEAGIGQATGNYWVNVSLEYDSSDKLIKKYLSNTTYNYLFLSGQNLSSAVLFTNSTIIYEYHLINRLKKINNFIDNIEYGAFEKVSNKTYANNLIAKYEYDNQSRITSIITGNIQNLTYTYDAVGNVKVINDSKNRMKYAMDYDDLDRVVNVIIYNYNTYENERFKFVYNKIGGILAAITDGILTNYTYTSAQAHAPSNIIQSNRPIPRIDISLINPIGNKNVTRYNLFNFTTQTCCKDNDCWGINVSLDPEQSSYTPATETTCNSETCTTVLYSRTNFVYENNSWKRIEDANSLKNVWTVQIDGDVNFPAEIVDYNYTFIILNLSVSNNKLDRDIPLRIYNKYNRTQLPLDRLGNEINKDKSFRFGKSNDEEIVTIDLSDTEETLLTQKIKWGDNSTIITVYDNNSADTDDSYIRDGSFSDTNFGTDAFLYIQNSSSSTLNKEDLIRFDMSQLPRQAIIDEARLFLYIAGNNLLTGQHYNVSVYSLNQTYQWREGVVTWTTGPKAGNYSEPYLEKVTIFNTDINKYFSWNVTLPVKQKNRNESFYLKAVENHNAASDIRFRSKENPGSQKPYLNVTYRLKGLVSNTLGETPFYTSVTNPSIIDLEQDKCQNVTWFVNATGSLGDYVFFAYANKTSNSSLAGAFTDLVNVSIV